MICPKCRTKYDDGVSVCPDCGLELIGLMGDADAPDEEDTLTRRQRHREAAEESNREHNVKMRKTVIDENDEFSPVVYKSFDEMSVPAGKRINPLGIFFLIVSLLFVAASAAMFYLAGRQGSSAPNAAAISEVLSAVLPF